MKSLGSSGHGVWCFQNTGNSATTGESLLSNQNVDASLLNLMFQDISTQKAFVKNKYKHQAFAVDSKSKKTILQTYYNCEVFKPAIAAASEQTHKADINTFKGLEAIAIKVGTFSEEDPRKLLTEQEWLHTYRGVGVIHSVGNGFGTGLAIACPDGINDIVITNYHGIKKNKNSQLSYFDYNRKTNLYDKKTGIAKNWVPSANKLPGANTDLDDWAVLKLKTPLPSSVQTFEVDERVIQKYTGCVDFVSQTHMMVAGKKEMWRFKQRCEITDIDNWKASSKGITRIKHNCHTLPSNSGGALFACDSKKLVGMHFGTYRKNRKLKVQPYVPDDGRPDYHFSAGMLLDKGLLDALRTSCAE